MAVPTISRKGEPKGHINNVNAGFMLAVAIILDVVQIFLTISVFFIIATFLVSFLAIIIFGLWFYILGANFFSGRQAGMKVIAALSSICVELVPVLDAIPSITLGVLAVIVATRLEEKAQAASTQTSSAVQEDERRRSWGPRHEQSRARPSSSRPVNRMLNKAPLPPPAKVALSLKPLSARLLPTTKRIERPTPPTEERRAA